MTNLQLEKLSFNYQGRRLFTDLNFTVQPGSFGLLTGPSGSGKSTLLKLLAGLLPQYGGQIVSGRALLDGQNVGEIVPFQRAQKVAMLFQHPGRQFALKTVTEQVRFALANLRVPAAQINQRLAETLAWLGIDQLAGRQLATLSGGEQQKVALACLLAMDSEIILLDEPFANVDLASRHQLLVDLQRLQKERGKTILVADHDLSGYQGVADRWYQLDREHQLTNGDPAQLPAAAPLIPVQLQPLQPPRLAGTNLRLSVGSRLLLDHSDLQIPRGQLGLLSGDNGAGKSTLLAALSRQRPFGGQLAFAGRPAQQFSLRQWALKVGWVFQNSPDQFIAVQAADELRASRRASCRPEYWTRSRVQQTVAQLGLTGCLGQTSYQLSGGQQKKLQLLSMLIMAQPVMLLDEPFAGLDSQSLATVLGLLRQVAADLQIGMLIISHQRTGVVNHMAYEFRLAERRLTLLGGVAGE